MSSNGYTAYLDSEHTPPSGSEVNVYVRETLNDQNYGTIFTDSYQVPGGQLTLTVAPGELEFRVPAPSLQVSVKTQLPDPISYIEGAGFWKEDSATDYPGSGDGFWTLATGFIISGDFDTYEASLWTD